MSAPLPSGAPPRSLTTRLAPSAPKSRACSRPMPRPPPVMTATRPSSHAIVSVLLFVDVSARDLGEPVLDDDVAGVGGGLEVVAAPAAVPEAGGGWGALGEPHCRRGRRAA